MSGYGSRGRGLCRDYRFRTESIRRYRFVDVTTVGETLPQNEVFGTIEAVKTVSDAFLPVGGEILEFNEALNDAPDRVNKDPYGEGWIVKIRMTDPAELNVLLGARRLRQADRLRRRLRGYEWIRTFKK